MLPRPLSNEIAGDEIAAGGDLLHDLWSCVKAREIDGAARLNDWIRLLHGRVVV